MNINQLLPLLGMMNGGKKPDVSQMAQLFAGANENGQGGMNPSDLEKLLPLVAMMQQTQKPAGGKTPPPAAPTPAPVSSPAPARKNQYFAPIIDFAGPDIVYRLAKLL